MQAPKFITLVILALLASSQSQNTLNNSPVIGVFTEPSGFSTYGYPSSKYSYIAGSYIKHMQSAGAQVIPIQWDLPQSQLLSIFNQINGLLFPGGATTIASKGVPTSWGTAGQYLINLAIQANQNGDYFPVMATCLGFELLSETFANNYSLLISIPTGSNVQKNLSITPAGYESLTFKSMDPDLEAAVGTQNLAFFHHTKTPDPLGWASNPYLAGNFTVTSLTTDATGITYAASIEGINWPIYGSQFHPEKNTYEWYTSEGIPHQHNAIRFQQFWANFFVNKTRNSSHTMDSSTLQSLSIENYPPNHLSKNPEFELVYFFANYNGSVEIVPGEDEELV